MPCSLSCNLSVWIRGVPCNLSAWIRDVPCNLSVLQCKTHLKSRILAWCQFQKQNKPRNVLHISKHNGCVIYGLGARYFPRWGTGHAPFLLGRSGAPRSVRRTNQPDESIINGYVRLSYHALGYRNLMNQSSMARPMWFKFFYPGFETCFGWGALEPGGATVQVGPDSKTHLKSRFCLQAILKKGSDVILCKMGAMLKSQKGERCYIMQNGSDVILCKRGAMYIMQKGSDVILCKRGAMLYYAQ